jgi:hypothetical protein
MLRQYYASPFRGGDNPRRVGTIDVGQIVYLQDGLGPFGPGSRFWSPVFRNPWIVEAWHPRELLGKRCAGGHLATVRSLRDGRRQVVADWLLRMCLEL